MDLDSKLPQDRPPETKNPSQPPLNPNRARDHLANERTFLAWLRTGMSAVIFGFAIGRFGLVIREIEATEGHHLRGTGLSVWVGMLSIVAGIMMVGAGLVRYRRVRTQLDQEEFEPAGSLIDLLAAASALFAMLLAGYLLLVRQALK
jgi:putative membrane protein